MTVLSLRNTLTLFADTEALLLLAPGEMAKSLLSVEDAGQKRDPRAAPLPQFCAMAAPHTIIMPQNTNDHVSLILISLHSRKKTAYQPEC
jgi:hypothetical protein